MFRMTAITTCIVLTLGLSFAGPALAQPPEVIGAWDVEVDLATSGPVRAMLTFHADQTVLITSYQLIQNPFYGFLSVGGAHGVWRQVAANPDQFEFEAHAQFFQIGSFVPSLMTITTGQVMVNGGGTLLAGTVDVEVVDLGGNPAPAPDQGPIVTATRVTF